MEATSLKTLKEVQASLARDAELMRELRATEAWDCILHQLDKMEAMATDHILSQGTSMDQVNFWRGRLAAVKEFRTVPELIIGWYEHYAKMS